MSANSIAPALQRLGKAVERVVIRPAFWVLFVLVATSWPIVRAMRAEPPPRLPVLGTVPAFELTSQEGKPFGSAQLRGRTWVGAFLFTRCPTVCPALTSTL